VLSGNPFILILGIFAFGIFFYLLRIRASKKQIESFERTAKDELVLVMVKVW
jgi:hypothetical protein